MIAALTTYKMFRFGLDLKSEEFYYLKFTPEWAKSAARKIRNRQGSLFGKAHRELI